RPFLGEKGYKLTCFDLSSDMLSRAYEKLRSYKNIKILKQDMTDFSFENSFDAIVSVCDSINYISDIEKLYKTFHNVWKHLDDGGIFIFDINSYHKLKNIIGHNTFIEDREEVFYTWQNYFDDSSNICNFYLSFFYSRDGRTYKRFDEEHRQRAYRVEEVVDSLEKAGFNHIDYYAAFGFDRPEEDTERINFVAIK
ncbi:MAG: class I SAM-dependent methyltransferase, partial [Tissierellaceae bacterium]